MVDLILIIMLIISLFKPDILLSAKIKEKANEEQKAILVKNTRKVWAVFVATVESAALTRYTTIIGRYFANYLRSIMLYYSNTSCQGKWQNKRRIRIMNAVNGRFLSEERRL